MQINILGTANQLERLKIRLEETTTINDMLLSDILDSAKAVIISRRFPYGTDILDVPIEYSDLQIRIAIEIYNRIGAEGELSHSENGISRNYQSANISQSLLNEIIPKVGVI